MTIQEAETKISGQNKIFKETLASFAVAYQQADDAEKQTLLGNTVAAHSDLLNTVNTCLEELHEKYNFLRKKTIAKKFEATVKNFLNTSFDYRDLMVKLSANPTEPIKTHSPYSYSNIQTFLNTISGTETIKRYKNEFIQRNIPVDGFDDKLKTPESQFEKDKQRNLSIIVGSASVAIVLAIMLFKEKVPENLSIYLTILFAIGCGGISAALLGNITIDLKQTKGISAGGGLAVMVLILIWFPIDPELDMSVFLKNKNDNSLVDGNNLKLSVRLDQNLKPGEYLPTSNSFIFRPLPPNYINQTTELILNKESKWVFVNGRKDTAIVLRRGHVDIDVTRDSQSLLLRGYVKGDSVNDDDRSNFIIISEDYPALKDTTDNNGYFEIAYPSSYEAESGEITIKKTGYKPLTEKLALNYTHKIVMSKN